MKKLIIFSILAHLLLTINSHAINQESDQSENENVLKIGVLLPLKTQMKIT